MESSSVVKSRPEIINKDKKLPKVESPKEDKILNSLTGYEMFISIAEAFENSLNCLEIYDSHEEVYEKLLNIEKLLKAKISSLKKLIKGRSISQHNLKDLNLSKSSWTSLHSLCSQKSDSLLSLSHLSNDSDFLDFMNRVDCPFCSKTQCNKTELILHLSEECISSNLTDLKKKDFIPFSTFQILSNNTFKCNVCLNSYLKTIKDYFDHARSVSHTSLLNNVKEKKQFCDALYCYYCKTQIPNNYTQIYFHISNYTHLTSCLDNEKVLSRRGICCLYKKSKTFKCLVCPIKHTFNNFVEVKAHLKNTENTGKITHYVLHCESCSKNVHFSKFNAHISSSAHMNKEKKKFMESSFEACLYCSFMCDTKMTLFLHMKSQCTVINDIKEKYNLLEYSAEQDVIGKTTEEEVDIEEHDKGNFLIVKDNTNIFELLIYFGQFGNVEKIKVYNEKDVLIKFSQKSSLKCVLLNKFSHKINGETLTITTTKNYLKDTKKTRNKKNIHSGARDCNISLDEKYCDKSKDTDLNFDTEMQDDEELVNLFQRAVNHLLRNKQSLDSGRLLMAAVDETVEAGISSFVGFLESDLSFSVESVSLHVNVRQTFHDDKTLIEVNPFNDSIWMNSYKKLCSSNVWENVEFVYSKLDIPHIKCVHKQFKKPCTITFMQSPKILSSMLRDCVIGNDLVRSFCMLVRFWVNVHELAIKQFDYVLISLLVYFLKSKNMVDKSFEYYKEGTRAELLDKAISEKSRSVQPLHSDVSGQFLNVKELFQEFMKFLLTFNFQKYAICLPLDYPVPREFFTKVESREILSKLSNPDKLNKSFMCILDPLIYINLASDINSSDVRSFLQAASKSCKN